MYIRTLEYKVTGQRLRPIGDHTGLVAGTSGYLNAKFSFSPEWDSYKKAISFYNAAGNEYAILLDDYGTCLIPTEAITDSTFKVQVWGQSGNTTINTNFVRERQQNAKT